MKKYIQPNIKVKELELDGEMMAASGELKPSAELQQDQITDGETEVLSKETPAHGIWDE